MENIYLTTSDQPEKEKHHTNVPNDTQTHVILHPKHYSESLSFMRWALIG